MRACVMTMVILLAMVALSPAHSYGCFEPYPQGEVHSDALDVCVAAETPST